MVDVCPERTRRIGSTVPQLLIPSWSDNRLRVIREYMHELDASRGETDQKIVGVLEGTVKTLPHLCPYTITGQYV